MVLTQRLEKMVKADIAGAGRVQLQQFKAMGSRSRTVGEACEHCDVGDKEAWHKKVPCQSNKLVQRNLLGRSGVATLVHLSGRPVHTRQVEVERITFVQLSKRNKQLGEVLASRGHSVLDSLLLVHAGVSCCIVGPVPQLLDLERHQGKEIGEKGVQAAQVELLLPHTLVVQKQRR